MYFVCVVVVFFCVKLLVFLHGQQGSVKTPSSTGASALDVMSVE